MHSAVLSRGKNRYFVELLLGCLICAVVVFAVSAERPVCAAATAAVGSASNLLIDGSDAGAGSAALFPSVRPVKHLRRGMAAAGRGGDGGGDALFFALPPVHIGVLLTRRGDTVFPKKEHDCGVNDACRLPSPRAGPLYSFAAV